MEFHAHVFDKIDGSNLRFEWSRKPGWYKFGTRKRWFDHNDEDFGEAIPLFMSTLAEPLAKMAYDKKWGRIIAFAEFWGDNSLGGLHHPDDEKRLTLFDFNVHKKGLLSPELFREHFEGTVDTPKYLGKYWWNKTFMDNVRRCEIEGITFEGVVGKAIVNDQLVMAKAKTSIWLDEIRAKRANAESLINS
jgi:hypothetical protein